MPTYDYKCKACGHQFELFHGMSEPARRKCPECGKLALVRLFGAGAGIIFKGSGFYETDYKRRNGKTGRETGKKEGGTCGKSTDCPKKKECPAADS